MKKHIQEYKKESILNKQFRYPEGIMTRKEWLNYWRIKGATVNEALVPLIEYNRSKFNRLEGNAQDEYWNKCQQKKIGYRLCFPDESFMEITKTEYDHFKDLELSEDINTQKNELSEKIEAGTATEEEINTAMDKEFEFAAKYFD